MWTRYALLALVLASTLGHSACAALAGGAVGAAVGHEVAEENDEDE